MSFDPYHSHKSLVSWESAGPRSARYEESLSHLSRQLEARCISPLLGVKPVLVLVCMIHMYDIYVIRVPKSKERGEIKEKYLNKQ